jgi:hypothetical protein
MDINKSIIPKNIIVNTINYKIPLKELWPLSLY